MSWQIAEAPQCTGSQSDPVEVAIVPRAKDIGDFEVRRALPAKARQMVGPFIFFDQMGPTVLGPDQAMDVRPHPHIGISTITWLFEGQVRHRDSLGYDVVIKPGEVNWMTAGAGIVHSERSPDEDRPVAAPLAGIQTWVALPADKQEIEPAFYHYEASEIPHFDERGIRISLITGSAWGEKSPVRVESETLYAEVNLARGSSLAIPDNIEERAVYVYSGSLDVSGTRFGAGTMAVLKPEAGVTVSAPEDCRFMLLGGASLEGPRYLYWNFVSNSRERIEQAKDDWLNQRFARVAGDDEFIPLPGN